jgi:uncharacterized protein
MENVARAVARFVIRFRLPILIVSVLLCLLSIYVIATQYRLAQNIKDDLPKHDPQIIAFEEFLEQFGDAELLVVAIEAEDVFTQERLEYIQRLTRLFEQIRDVQETLSLTNAMEILGNDGVLAVELLIDGGVPESAEELARLRVKALSNRFWVNSLVSADGTAAAINMKLEILRDDATYRFEVVKRVQEILNENPPPPNVERHFTGVSVFGRDSLDAMQSDMVNFIWLMPILVLVLLFAVFRTFRGVFVPQIVIWFAVGYTLAILFATGKSITMISTMLPVLIGVIAISDVIHILARYYEQSQTITDRKELTESALAHMIPPCFLTSTTTAAGFAALMISNLTQVRDFGLFAAIGLMSAFGVAISVAPIILSYLPPPKKSVRNIYSAGPTNRILVGLNRFVERDRWITLVLAVAIIAVSVAGIMNLKIETQLSKFLPQTAPSVKSLHWLQEKMAGVSSLEVTLRGDPGTFKEPWALAEIEQLEKYLESLPGVDKVFSIVDFVRTFNEVLHDQDPAFDRIPESRQAVAQYLLLFEMTGRDDLLSSFINADYSYTRISARIQSMGSAGHADLIAHMQEYADRLIDSRLQYNATGMVVLYATITNALVRSQIGSLGIAFFIITIMMILHLRSVKLGLLSMVPNTFPIAVTLGMMGLFEISLNVATVMIACIALGIAVDDTIHYLSRYGAEIHAGKSEAEARRATMMGAGRGMVFTSIVITGGFFVLCFSSFHTNRAFGILTGITMVTAVFADLMLLPVLMKLLGIKK